MNAEQINSQQTFNTYSKETAMVQTLKQKHETFEIRKSWVHKGEHNNTKALFLVYDIQFSV